MHARQLWVVSSFYSGTSLVWSRLTFSRLTLAYFIFSVCHFVIQLSLQIKAFTINEGAATLLNDIVEQAGTYNGSFPFLQSGSTLRLCNWVPLDVSVDQCPVVWQEGSNTSEATSAIYDLLPSSTQIGSAQTTPTPAASRDGNFGISATPLSQTTRTTSTIRETITVFVPSVPTSTGRAGGNPDRLNSSAAPADGNDKDDEDNEDNVGSDDEEESSDDGEDGEDERERASISVLRKRDDWQISVFRDGAQVKVNISGEGHETATLDSSCLWALNWPSSVLDNTKREDIVFIAFQFWVLGMSIVALFNESIPHIFASLLTHVMATAWAGFQISHTADFRANFNKVITNGACKGTNLLPHYWDARKNAEIPSFALNVFALVLSAILTWKLVKLFGWQTFKRVGASLTINRIYMFVLSLSIAIQLSLFFMAVTVSLWVDQLFNSAIGDVVDFNILYKVTSFITLALLVPWLMAGWFAVRRELRLPMFFFLTLSILYLGGWGVMFFSTTFRWTFLTWRFFSIMAVASVSLTLMSFLLGVVCRFNFGKGLLRYLGGQQTLPNEAPYIYDGAPRDIEKVDFPSNEKPIPTFSVTFGIQTNGPDFSGSVRGPRFFNTSAEPFESSRDISISPPPLALTRQLNDTTAQDSSLQRSSNHRHAESSSSYSSYLSYRQSTGNGSPTNYQQIEKKRWVIE
ncbi:hypothetical protein BDQ17DRAFT_1295304 [Cyathus striatus]|nr:hypothetical protein BDQ17DRAFT_1295304 [Cyathus striatus]